MRIAMWLAENWANILISGVLVLIVTLIVVGMIKKKKKGLTSCGCSCSGCPMSGSCHDPK